MRPSKPVIAVPRVCRRDDHPDGEVGKNRAPDTGSVTYPPRRLPLP
jgi:hypothetical protein